MRWLLLLSLASFGCATQTGAVATKASAPAEVPVEQHVAPPPTGELDDMAAAIQAAGKGGRGGTSTDRVASAPKRSKRARR